MTSKVCSVPAQPMRKYRRRLRASGANVLTAIQNCVPRIRLIYPKWKCPILGDDSWFFKGCPKAGFAKHQVNSNTTIPPPLPSLEQFDPIESFVPRSASDSVPANKCNLPGP